MGAISSRHADALVGYGTLPDAENVGVLVAVGSKAQREGAARWPDARVIAVAASTQNGATVTTRPDGAAMARAIKALVPRGTKVAAIQSRSSSFWTQFRQGAAAEGLSLQLEIVEDAKAIGATQSSLMRSADVLLVIDDPMWTPEALQSAFKMAYNSGFPIMSFSESHLASPYAPIAVAVAPPASIGAVAANLAGNAVSEEISGVHGPEPTIIGHKSSMLNARLVVGKSAKDIVDRWY